MNDTADSVRPQDSAAQQQNNGAAPVAYGQSAGRKRIVIVGAGFAGIAAARALRHCAADVLLIDRRNHHIFQPLLYQVATAVLSPAEIAAPIRQLMTKQSNLNVVLGEAIAVDTAIRTVTIARPGIGEREIPFDFLVVATGVQPSYFGQDELARYAPGLKSLSDAVAIRTKMLDAFELADETTDEPKRTRQMTFVVVGAGPAGVELAASLAHLVTVTLREQFRHIDPATCSIMLVEGGKRILPAFDERLAAKAANRLEQLGVHVLTGVKVEKVDEGGVVADGKRIPSATVLWTAGVAASPVVKQLGAKLDRAGRMLVGPFMNVEGVPGVFVAGDTSSVISGGRPVPGVAQAAIQEGRYVGRRIAQQLLGQDPKDPFRYRDRGTMAVVGKNFAILESGPLRMSGFLTWLVWVFLHLMSLPQLQNRLRVQMQWLWSYFSGQRSSRLIPELPRFGSHGPGY